MGRRRYGNNHDVTCRARARTTNGDPDSRPSVESRHQQPAVLPPRRRRAAMTRRLLTCREVVELATEYFEASLPPEQSEPFAAHVAGCRGCQSYLRQLRITVEILHTEADRAPAD